MNGSDILVVVKNIINICRFKEYLCPTILAKINQQPRANTVFLKLGSLKRI
ncbi:unnamed protein product [Moneuplotes crassus]|uniref:Uncharacterized protein n=1 Tax=Euplotes crassus TaxID=5936 RepID=A0AAD2D615_EUPCR|nr:unnamed protein product [Moneuplotes crassus]